jgi:hypothetical protein
MGTNYYVRTPRCANACEHCSASETIHLGKSSVGWKFCHRADPDWPREQAHTLWRERATSGEIHDEYQRPISLDELLKFIDVKQKGRSHTTYNPEMARIHGQWLYDSLRASDFDCDGYDFCDREFS